VEKLLGRPLSSATTRMELWLALSAVGGTGGSPGGGHP